jgi:hypothetical protein
MDRATFFDPTLESPSARSRDSLTEEAYAELSRRAPIAVAPTLAPSRGPDRALLVWGAGGELRGYRRVPEEGLRIGRGPDADLQVADDAPARHLAMIHHEGRAGFVLYDLAPENGTEVDGRTVTRWVLEDGDVIRFGAESVFRFSLTDATGERKIAEACAARPVSRLGLRPPAPLRRVG